ncbi:dihydroorotate dehydrogenase [Candidatus Woesearchaeota archaeon]|nr:dihydroorotate dehydrogenase [Candidatus Woesearchaeota archaeon]
MLKTRISKIELDNPTILASGILGVTKDSLKRVIQNGAGAVTTKSISKEPRKGHKSPIILTEGDFMLNAVGISNPGVGEASKEFSALKELKAPVFGSIVGTTPEEFVEVLQGFSKNDFSAIEVPLSCPHTPGYGTMAGQGTPEATHKITSAIRDATKLPLIIKLSPNTQDLSKVAKAAEEAGADAICAVNSLGPGMKINIDVKKPVLGFGVGGLTGPALRPIAVRCVFDIYKSVDIPIIGTGGVTYGRDAIEMLMAGASAVGVGTAVYYREVNVFKKICDEMESWMKENNYTKIEQLIGAVHD